ncbi:MAG: divalent-cation tolerance protein CutA [Candidatus Omnitrophota bacterium]
MNTDFIIVLVTCGSKKEAARLADSLLKKRLIACANIVPAVFSKFRWKGRVDSAGEALIIIKTTRERFKAIEREIKRLHSYDAPEIIAIPIIEGSKEYLRWVEDNSKVKRKKPGQ